MNDCPYYEVCGAVRDSCTDSCIRYLEIRSLLEKSQLPVSRWKPVSLSPDDCDYDAFCKLADIKDEVDGFVASGQSLYIFSDKTGNGKTSWAIKLMLKYFDTVWAGNGFRCRGVFVHVPTLLTRLKNFEAYDPQLDELKAVLPTVDLAVWDDIASTNLSNYDHSQLISYIDQRVLNSKCNIFTGNLRQQGIEKSLGARLASRVWNASTRIELKGRDKR